MDKVVYIASPLSGDVEQNLDFARRACRYAISLGVTPFAPHLLYTQMLDDNSPQERRAGIEMGCHMNIIAASQDIDRDTLSRLQGECVKEVKRTNGNFSFKDAVDWQKG